MKDAPEAANFYLAVDIFKPKSAKRNNFKVASLIQRLEASCDGKIWLWKHPPTLPDTINQFKYARLLQQSQLFDHTSHHALNLVSQKLNHRVYLIIFLQDLV